MSSVETGVEKENEFKGLDPETEEFLDALADRYLWWDIADDERDVVYGDILPDTYAGTGTARSYFRPDNVGFFTSRLEFLDGDWSSPESTKASFSPKNLVIEAYDEKNGPARGISSNVLKLLNEFDIVEKDDWDNYVPGVDGTKLDAFYTASVLDFAYRWEEFIDNHRMSREEVYQGVLDGSIFSYESGRNEYFVRSYENKYFYTTADDNELVIMKRMGTEPLK